MNKNINRKIFLKKSSVFQRSSFHCVIFIIVASLVFTHFVSPALFCQETDPFFIRVLKQGEDLYSSGKYKDALIKLEIAGFGLSREKNLQIKSDILSSLCHFHLKAYEDSEKIFRKALEMHGEQALSELNLSQTASKDLNNLIKRLKIKPGDNSEEPPLSPPLSSEIKGDPSHKIISGLEKHTGKELEKEIKNNPKKAESLYSPSEVQGNYLLGKLEFRFNRFRQCEIYFNNVLKQSEKVPIEIALKTTAQAYLILSSHNRGNQKKTLVLITRWITGLEKNLDSLDMTGTEKDAIRSLMKMIKKGTSAQ